MTSRGYWIPLVVVSLALFSGARSLADTGTSLGDRGAEGSTQFTGLTQAPEANLFTGALTTSIKINLPPGRKNMTPDVSLHYSSNAGPSPLGQGWNLTIGRVERSTRWGVPRCTGEHADDFVLVMPNGTAELVPEDPNNPSGDRFRPRIEEKYLSVRRDTVANTWVAFDASGVKYTFGADPLTRIGTDPNTFMAEDPNGHCRMTSVWPLTRVEDPNGNIVEVHWINTANILYPDTIDYGGSVASPSIPHPYRVQFNYVAFPDDITIPMNRYGVDARLGQHLTSIEVKQSFDVAVPDLIRKYTFIYDGVATDGPYAPMLRSVSVDDTPVAQQFQYTEGALGFGEPQNLPAPAQFDYLRITDSSGEVRQTIMDMNGDGFVDLVQSENTGSRSVWWVYLGKMQNGSPQFAHRVRRSSGASPMIRKIPTTTSLITSAMLRTTALSSTRSTSRVTEFPTLSTRHRMPPTTGSSTQEPLQTTPVKEAASGA